MAGLLMSFFSRPGIAVSGGVDSMALAYLCSQIRKTSPEFKISDNPISNFYAFIIDHRLRENSTEEAKNVKHIVEQKMGLTAEVLGLKWADLVGHEVHPKDMPNFESLARRLRYRR